MCASSNAATSLHEKPEDGVCEDPSCFVTCCVISEVVVHEVDYTSRFCSMTLLYYLGFFHFFALRQHWLYTRTRWLSPSTSGI